MSQRTVGRWHAAVLEVVHRSACDCHVVVDHFAPGAAGPLGVGYEALVAVNLDLI